MQSAAEQRRHAFSIWLRTGRWHDPVDRREFKFNPWHDPRDGRFTFVGAGRYYGPDSARRDVGQSRVVPEINYFEDLRLPLISTREEVEVWRAEQLAKYGHKPEYRKAIEAQYHRYLGKLARPQENPTSRIRDQSGAVEPPGAPSNHARSGGGEVISNLHSGGDKGVGGRHGSPSLQRTD